MSTPNECSGALTGYAPRSRGPIHGCVALLLFARRVRPFPPPAEHSQESRQRDHGGDVLPSTDGDRKSAGGVERGVQEPGSEQAASGVDEDHADEVAEEGGGDEKDGPGAKSVVP